MTQMEIEAFLEVVRRGTISGAAQALFITQPALSRRLQALEEELGYPLFLRERGALTLTDNGRALLPYVQNYLKAGSALQEESQRLKDSVEGAVHIAAYNNVIRNWLPAILKRFHEKYPNIRISIRQSPYWEWVLNILPASFTSFPI